MYYNNVQKKHQGFKICGEKIKDIVDHCPSIQSACKINIIAENVEKIY